MISLCNQYPLSIVLVFNIFRLLDLQSKDYFPTTTIQPSNTANDEAQAVLTVTEIQPVSKTEESFPPLYGSELVMRSLDLREFVCVCVCGWVGGWVLLINKQICSINNVLYHILFQQVKDHTPINQFRTRTLFFPLQAPPVYPPPLLYVMRTEVSQRVDHVLLLPQGDDLTTRPCPQVHVRCLLTSS